jgi:hypothetical protein
LAQAVDANASWTERTLAPRRRRAAPFLHSQRSAHLVRFDALFERDAGRSDFYTERFEQYPALSNELRFAS